jgi:HEAT repeat protein
MDEQPGQDTESGHGPETETAGEPGLSGAERRAHFIRMLSDDDEVSRWKAAEVLGRMGDPEAVDELINTLWDDDARVRLKAAWALGQIGDQRAYAPLQRLYRMENEWAQEIIKEALENIRRHMAVQ